MKRDCTACWLKLKVAMKEVKYSRVNKAQTVIASLVMGCGHTKAINETLQPEQAAASYLGLERFPDQSRSGSGQTARSRCVR